MLPENTATNQIHLVPSQPQSLPSSAIEDQIRHRLAAIDKNTSPSRVDSNIQDIARILAAERATSRLWGWAYRVLVESCRQSGIQKPTKKEWTNLRNAAIATQAINNPVATQRSLCRVHDAIPGAPVPDDMLVPDGFQVVPAGVFSLGDEPVLIAPAPILISRRYVDDEHHTESVELAWHRDGEWSRQFCSRSQIASSREIVALSGSGLPVTSNSASDLVEYLSRFEAVNQETLPRCRVQRQFGWTKDRDAFLLGRDVISPRNEEQTGAEKASVQFHGADAGDSQAVAAYTTAGSMEGWKSAIEPLQEFPMAILVLLASFAAVLLRILEIPNFTVDLCGATSRGKTTLLQAAGSIWGRPDEKSPNSVVGSWNTTRVGSERRLGLANGLPTLRDDTQLATNPQAVAQTVYDVTEGQSRDRGTVQGLDRRVSFSTILISTGERPLVSFSPGGGTRGRTITLWGMPFGPTDRQAMVHAVRAGVAANYGHAGRHFVQHLLDRQAAWSELRDRHRNIRDEFATLAHGNTVLVRQSDAFAALTLAGELAAQLFDMPRLRHDAVLELWDRLAAETQEADRAALALQFVFEWAASHTKEFSGHQVMGNHQPPAGWVGTWSHQSQEPFDPEPWTYIGFIPSRLRELLNEQEFEADGVIRQWKDRDWLLVDPSDRTGLHKQLQLGSQRPRMIVVKREAFAAVGAIPSDMDQLTATRVRLVQMANTIQQEVDRLNAHSLSAGHRTTIRGSLQSVVASLQEGLVTPTSPSGSHCRGQAPQAEAFNTTAEQNGHQSPPACVPEAASPLPREANDEAEPSETSLARGVGSDLGANMGFGSLS